MNIHVLIGTCTSLTLPLERVLSELPLAVVRVTAPLGVGVPFDAAKVVPDFCEGVASCQYCWWSDCGM